MQRRSFTEILSDLIDRTLISTHDINDFTVGSTIRSIYESIGLELDSYYGLQERNIKWGIEQGIYEAFGFERLESRRAYGEVVLDFHTALQRPLVISRGTTFYSSLSGYEQVYETLRDYRVPAGQSRAVVTAYCTTPGIVGNVPKNVINVNANSTHNISAVRNPYAILTGQDQEPIENVKRRFREFIETRGRATDKAISYGVRQVEDISGVYVDGQVGRILVYAHDLNGNLPDNLKREVEAAVEEYRPSGIFLEVRPITKKEIDLNIEVTLTDKTAKTEAFRKEIEADITHYLNTKEVSENLILSSIVQRVKNIDDYLIYDVEVMNHEDNIILENNELIRAGVIGVTLH